MSMEKLILLDLAEAKKLQQRIIDAFNYELETSQAIGKKVNITLIAAMIEQRIIEAQENTIKNQ